jgi:O-antigen/teichoic acid export membrane protein
VAESGFFPSIAKWSPRLVVALADQGLASLSSFAFGVMLVRWISPQSFGAFSIAFSAYLLALGLHSGLVQEPMSVLGARLDDSELAPYLASQLLLQLGLGVLTSLVLCAVGALLGIWSTSTWLAFVSLALALPVLLTYQHLRRASYLLGRPAKAALAAVAYSSALAATLVVWSVWRPTSTIWTFAPLAVGSLAASILLLFDQAPAWPAIRGRRQVLAAALRGNWDYGRWAAGSGVVYWVSSYAYVPLVAALHGLAQAGAVRAMVNLTMPLNQFATAMGMMMLPHFASSFWLEGRPQARRATRRMVWLLAAIGVAYLIAVTAGGVDLIKVLYGSPYYAQFAMLAVLLTAAQAVAAMRQGWYTAARAPRILLGAQSVGALVTVTLGLYLVGVSGAIGMGWGQLVSTVAETAVLALLVRRAISRWPAKPGSMEESAERLEYLDGMA